MESSDVRRLALVLSVQAEVEGMKAENVIRDIKGEAPAYGEKEFVKKSEKLESLAWLHDEQL